MAFASHQVHLSEFFRQLCDAVEKPVVDAGHFFITNRFFSRGRRMKLCSLFATLGLAASLGVASMAQAADKPEIKICYVNVWADSVASSETAAAIIREKLHYPVKLVAVSAGPLWSGGALGALSPS